MLNFFLETCILFLHILLEIKISIHWFCWGYFERCGYQKDTGDIPHIHKMNRIKWEDLSEIQRGNEAGPRGRRLYQRIGE